MSAAGGVESRSLTAMADCAAALLEDEQLAWLETIPIEITKLLDQISILEGGCWLVGGAVREALLGSTPVDWDMASTVHPVRLLEHLEKLNDAEVRVIPTGLKYGTLTIVWSGVTIEITTLRTESSYADGRRPELVKFGNSLEVDLRRRDFTVNSMAIDIQRGLLHDPNLGLHDLRKRCIRAVGNARRRIAEDGLRLLRAYRFIDRGVHGLWDLDEGLLDALRSEQWMLEKVAAERKWAELRKIICGRHAVDVLGLMASHDVLEVLTGERFLSDEAGIRAHAASQLDPAIPAAMRLGLLFGRRSRESLRKAAELLILSNKERHQALSAHRLLGNPPALNDRGLIRLWREVAGASFEQQLQLDSAWAAAHGDDLSALCEQISDVPPLKAGSLPLAGGELIMARTGIGQGPRLGRMKQWLHRIQIERDLAELEDIEDVLATLHWQHTDHEDWPRVDWPA